MHISVLRRAMPVVTVPKIVHHGSAATVAAWLYLHSPRMNTFTLYTFITTNFGLISIYYRPTRGEKPPKTCQATAIFANLSSLVLPF